VGGGSIAIRKKSNKTTELGRCGIEKSSTWLSLVLFFGVFFLLWSRQKKTLNVETKREEKDVEHKKASSANWNPRDPMGGAWSAGGPNETDKVHYPGGCGPGEEGGGVGVAGGGESEQEIACCDTMMTFHLHSGTA